MHICARKTAPQAREVHPNRKKVANGCTFTPEKPPLMREKYIQIEGKWQMDVHFRQETCPSCAKSTSNSKKSGKWMYIFPRKDAPHARKVHLNRENKRKGFIFLRTVDYNACMCYNKCNSIMTARFTAQVISVPIVFILAVHSLITTNAQNN